MKKNDVTKRRVMSCQEKRNAFRELQRQRKLRREAKRLKAIADLEEERKKHLKKKRGRPKKADEAKTAREEEEKRKVEAKKALIKAEVTTVEGDKSSDPTAEEKASIPEQPKTEHRPVDVSQPNIKPKEE